jgi:hypothetical protein
MGAEVFGERVGGAAGGDEGEVVRACPVRERVFRAAGVSVVVARRAVACETA